MLQGTERTVKYALPANFHQAVLLSALLADRENLALETAPAAPLVHRVKYGTACSALIAALTKSPRLIV